MTARECWRAQYREARKVEGLRRAFQRRLPYHSLSLLVQTPYYAMSAALGPCDPLRMSLSTRLLFQKNGCRQALS